jgi:hypothetical protein
MSAACAIAAALLFGGVIAGGTLLGVLSVAGAFLCAYLAAWSSRLDG